MKAKAAHPSQLAFHPLSLQLLREIQANGYDPRRTPDPGRLVQMARCLGIELLCPPARPAG